jgi:endonuclease YncB( thermonuclease family)
MDQQQGGSMLTALLMTVALMATAQVDYVVDGDTIRLESGQYVRLIGIDTPEPGACGAKAAEDKLTRMIARNNNVVRLPNPASVDDADRYGRLLRYVVVGDKDTGKTLIRKGLADARYDSYDGYDWHPREFKYRQLDQEHADVCS